MDGFMDGIYLEDAQVLCVGTKRDELLVSEVTRLLMEANKRPTLTTRYKRQRLMRGITLSSTVTNLRNDVTAALLKSGRDETHSSDSDISVEMNVSASASSSSRFHTSDVHVKQRPRKADRLRLDSSGVRQAMNQKVSNNGSVAALPLFYEDPRTSKKSRAGSVLRAGVNRWMESDEGKAWLGAKSKKLNHKLNDGHSSEASVTNSDDEHA
jgi:hypothetical protein